VARAEGEEIMPTTRSRSRSELNRNGRAGTLIAAPDSVKFLDELFGGELGGRWFYLWHLPEKASRWFQSVKAAAKAAEALGDQDGGRDVYLGVSLADRDLGPTRRVEAAQAAGIVGLWLDVDFAGPGHKKKGLPPTEADAQALIAAMPLSASCVVHSGHGLQPWWMFKEPWLFAGPEERARAAGLALGWNELLARKGADRGWAVDRVHDLSRVMRLPGTWNYKDKENPVLAKILVADWTRRYDPGDFEPFNVPQGPAVPQGTAGPYKCGSLVLRPDASPSYAKMEALLANCPEFKRVWSHKKTFPSASECDLSLASFAVRAGWSDQEIADLLIFHRRTWHPEGIGKATRFDYVAWTISKARGNTDRAEAVQAVLAVQAALADDPPPPTDGADEVSRRATAFEIVSRRIGIRVTDFIQLGRERPVYTIVLADGREVVIGGLPQFFDSDRALARAIFAATGSNTQVVSRKDWPEVRKWLASVCRVIEPAESREASSVLAALGKYLGKTGFHSATEKCQVCQEGLPFYEDGFVHIAVEPFRQWLPLNWNSDRWDRTTFLNLLRVLGAEPQRVSFRVGPKVSSRNYYRLRRDVLGDLIDDLDLVEGKGGEGSGSNERL
jgi:putative DNA primase/helicase